ncbi:unnamed protein product [Linum trigynum]|uniref:Uncharacterized protein n=1 Tax=Linum trigynum TaxID=586398 RepID=A0AAV2EWT2_9ROSI
MARTKKRVPKCDRKPLVDPPLSEDCPVAKDGLPPIDNVGDDDGERAVKTGNGVASKVRGNDASDTPPGKMGGKAVGKGNGKGVGKDVGVGAGKGVEKGVGKGKEAAEPGKKANETQHRLHTSSLLSVVEFWKQDEAYTEECEKELQKAGFDGLLEIPMSDTNKFLLSTMIEHYDPTSGCFIFWVGEKKKVLTLEDEDVARAYELRPSSRGGRSIYRKNVWINAS